MSFRQDILAAFFSDVVVIDARAINARTVAITGKAAGLSRMVVFTRRYPGDMVGQPHDYQVEVKPNPSTAPGNPITNPAIGAGNATVTLDTDKVSAILRRRWPDGNIGFEAMFAEEIQKRDRQIEELKKQLAAK